MKKHIYLLSSLLMLCTACNSDKTIIEGIAIDFVDPFIGTGFHGHTYPGATVPYGAIQLSPDTRNDTWDGCSGYHYSDNTIIGFSHTHLSGTGCADFGDVLFRPTTKPVDLASKSAYIFSSVPFAHNDEKASPGYYSVVLPQENLKVELTSSKYCGVHRYTFGANEAKQLIVDLKHTLTEERIDLAEIRKINDTEIAGMRRSQGWVTDQYVYFVAQFSESIDQIDFIQDRKIVDRIINNDNGKDEDVQALLSFGKSNQESNLIIKVGVSIVSEENARENLARDTEAYGFDFDKIHQNARDLWTEELADFTVKSTSLADLKNFYTALYHSKVVPNIINDVNGDFRRNNGLIANVGSKKRYSTFSIWDTFRAWNPLLTLTNTQLVTDMINSYLDIYDVTGELPIWPLSAGETYTMIGYHSASVIYDAYAKGIRDFDVEKAYEAMKVSSNINKKGSDYYIKLGFIPSNIKNESVSCLLEYAYDDWCIAQMAKSLGKEKDSDEYLTRAQNYINVFDGSTRFFRGKRLDGNFETPFNTFEPGRAYTEATAWQYRFFVPHDVNGMVQLYGGKDEFVEALDDLFTIEEGVDGDLVDITGLIGQYAHGNEPSHHMAYLYSYVGQPWKTQEMTRRLLKEMYAPTPEGIIGNEDCGQMSAWYIFSSLGFYPVCPGTNEFVLTTPLFEEVSMRLANGKTLVVKAPNAHKNQYVKSVKLNDIILDKNFITYDQIVAGGVLEFALTNDININRGTDSESLPYSLSNLDNIVSIPYTENDLYLFEDVINVSLLSATQDATIYYTLDGTIPTEQSEKYELPFRLGESAEIKARAYKQGYKPSSIFSINATKADYFVPVSYSGRSKGVNYKYFEGNFNSTSDLLKYSVVESGIYDNITIEFARQEDHFGYIFSGYIYAPEKGVYEFATKSDDGSILKIHNNKIVDNDGSHAAITATGRIGLEKGYHPFEVLYFEDYEGEHLSWYWNLPSEGKLSPIPSSNLYR